MKQTNKKIELLAPVGNFEKLEIAIHYGADAVYLGGKEFSLRNFSGNFTIAELEKALKLARNHGVKVYLTCNVFARNSEQAAVADYLQTVGPGNHCSCSETDSKHPYSFEHTGQYHQLEQRIVLAEFRGETDQCGKRAFAG